RPVLTRPAFSTEGSSLEIDRSVKSLVEQGLSLYRVEAERLKALQPDFIVTQSQCEVCAVSEGELEKALGDWVGKKAHIVSLKPDSLADVCSDIRACAETLGVAGRGQKLVQELAARMAEIERRAAADLPRPGVACLEWFEPLMAAGNWMPELVSMAGGQNLFGEAGKHSPWLDWETLATADPETILLMPCGFDLAKVRAALPELEKHPAWKKLRAVREGRVYMVDGNQYFNRPGPRLAESLEILAEILHPEEFNFGYRGKGWEPLTGL
ncbi:MAG TPA: ABC transporter substrate-binding protein, partial [bacterium]|nr:ABC transporter substrate-binding protein [bacterium]